MDILKIKVNGEWQSVVAIKGDTGAAGQDGKDGEDYILTSLDKQEIAQIVLDELVDGEEMSF